MKVTDKAYQEHHVTIRIHRMANPAGQSHRGSSRGTNACDEQIANQRAGRVLVLQMASHHVGEEVLLAPGVKLIAKSLKHWPELLMFKLKNTAHKFEIALQEFISMLTASLNLVGHPLAIHWPRLARGAAAVVARRAVLPSGVHAAA